MRTAQMDVMFTTNAPWRRERWEGMKRKAEGRAAAEEPLAKVGREEQETTGTAIMREVVQVVDTMIDDVEWMNDATKFIMSSLAKLPLFLQGALQDGALLPQLPGGEEPEAGNRLLVLMELVLMDLVLMELVLM